MSQVSTSSPTEILTYEPTARLAVADRGVRHRIRVKAQQPHFGQRLVRRCRVRREAGPDLAK